MRIVSCILCIVASLAITEAASQQGIPRDSLHIDSETDSKTHKRRGIPYFVYFQSGALVGCNDCSEKKEVSFTASVVHGFSLSKKLRVGAGIGFDSYANWQTLPLFGSVSWDLLGNKNTNALFLQFNYGWAHPWLNKTARTYGYKEVNGGKMYALSLGYRIRYHDLRLSFALGLKSQDVSSYYEYPTYYTTITGQVREGMASTQKLEEELKRVQFAMAIGWK